jgi:hypothetical protein
LALHVGERLLQKVEDLGVRICPHEELPQHADARAPQPILVEKFQIAVGPLSLARRRHRIGRIVAGNHIEHGHRIGHSARHRTADVAVQK